MASSSAVDPSAESIEHKSAASIENHQPTNVNVAVNFVGVPGAGPTNVFDANAPQYRCCCGCMHIRHGALTIAIIELIFSVLVLINYLASTHYAYTLIYLCSSIIQVPIAILLIIGVMLQNQYFLIPYLIYTIIQVILTIVVFGFMISVVVQYDVNVALVIFYSIFCVCGIALALWFAWIVYKCYGYLRDRKCQIASGAVCMGQP
uniref:Uncharacterized protein n=1 Tax=Panagrolaimus superbus TaxID=310955 RepID=A0A914YCM5_9BILA